MIIISDENTVQIADKICGKNILTLCVLKSGEENKNWQSIEKILLAAKNSNLSRDGIFIAAGGGVTLDLAAFAASVYMRGCRLVFICTSLLAMVDASIGGKTGFDLFNIKNLAGSFYPAEAVYMPLDALSTLPEKEWKNGFAELIKTAALSGDDSFMEQLAEIGQKKTSDSCPVEYKKILNYERTRDIINKAVLFKGNIVSEDTRESGKRMLLNLGHTFGHALESALGFNNVSHGEAVAWGMLKACDLGLRLGITQGNRAEKIKDLIQLHGYKKNYSYNPGVLIEAMKNDKKKRNGKLTFIVPNEEGARTVTLSSDNDFAILNNVLKNNLD
ncbi:MAG: 3-dehydroquinate synthase [Treponema sp.]|nr:3-dehydroquinate synthase [Treponema sp.]